MKYDWPGQVLALRYTSREHCIKLTQAALGAILAGGIAIAVFPPPWVPAAVLFSALGFLGVLGLLDPAKMLVAYFFLIPLININYLIGHASFAEYLYGSQAYQKGIHFDGAAALLVVGLWLLAMLRGSYRLPQDPVFLALWVFYLATSFLAVLLSASDRFVLAWWSLGEQFTYFALFMVCLSIARDKGTADKIIFSLALGGTFAALAPLINLGLQGLNSAQIPFFYWSHAPSESFPGTVPHRNYFGALMLITIPLTLRTFFHEGRQDGRHRLFWGACMLVQVIAFTFARCKGAILGMIAIGLFLVWKWHPRWNRVILISFLVIAYGAGAILWAANSPGAGSPVAVSSAVRGYMVKVSFSLPIERVWTGYGLNTFSRAFLELERRSQGPEVPSFRKDMLHGGRILETSSHNGFLGRLVETGLLGLVSFVVLLGYAFRRLRKNYLKDYEAIDSVSLYGSAIMVGLVVQAFTEDLFSYSKLVVIFWGLAAIGAAAGQGEPAENRGGVVS